MPAFSVKLAHLYQIDLAQASIEQKSWDAQPVQNKMRKHFLGVAGSSWASRVTSVKCSTGGAKGVYFLQLDKKKLWQNPPVTLPPLVCAMKATDAPQQTLFAEYILHGLGNAKIPKSLIIKLDWAEYTKQNYDAMTSNWKGLNLAAATTDDGLKMLWVIMTKRDARLTAEETTRYDDLATDLFTNKPQYFVIMKGMRIDDKLDFPLSFNNTTQQWEADLAGLRPQRVKYSPFSHRMVDPFNLPRQQSTNNAYRLSELGKVQDELSAWWNEATLQLGFARKGYPQKVDQLRIALGPGQAALPGWYQDYANNNDKFGKVLTRIFLNKIILDNADLMKKAGRILAVDTLIGNTDRFEGGSNGMNIGNAFFYSKTYQDRQQRGKVRNPIAVIDNDVLLTILDMFTPEGVLGQTASGTALNSTNQKVASQLVQYGNTYPERLQKRYMEYLLELGFSSLVPGAGGAGVFAYPKLMKLFADFDLYIAEQLVRTFISQKTPLINDIYADNGTIAPGRPGTYRSFSAIPHAQNVIDPSWAPVVANIKAGFLEGMDAILNLDLEDYRAAYSRLLRLYGIANHFDFTAFEIRHMYIVEGPLWQRNNAGNVTGFQHDKTRHANVMAKIKQDYFGKTNATKDQIEQALITANISQADRRLATELLRLQFQCP